MVLDSPAQIDRHVIVYRDVVDRQLLFVQHVEMPLAHVHDIIEVGFAVRIAVYICIKRVVLVVLVIVGIITVHRVGASGVDYKAYIFHALEQLVGVVRHLVFHLVGIYRYQIVEIDFAAVRKRADAGVLTLRLRGHEQHRGQLRRLGERLLIVYSVSPAEPRVAVDRQVRKRL